ncbi:hypothetical protein [Paenibacillus mesophilus]|uniref:hypothetical protein n=1 Tax=Paenibacillus mesophilus TaxID=2582849 RepID=UPI00130513F3|nr:hypothetical protein [Paenibacillus mesophilus]
MSEVQKPIEQKSEADKQEIELIDLPKELSEEEMTEVNGGFGFGKGSGGRAIRRGT